MYLYYILEDLPSIVWVLVGAQGKGWSSGVMAGVWEVWEAQGMMWRILESV